MDRQVQDYFHNADLSNMKTDFTKRNIADGNVDENKVIEDVDPANYIFLNAIIHDIYSARNDEIGE